MSASFILAQPEHEGKLCALVADFHAEAGIQTSQEGRRAALAPLLDGIPHGAAYLIGPARAPIGYVIISFGWSVEFGGLDGFVDEFYIRPSVRGRGIGTQVLRALPTALARPGLRVLHLEVARTNPRAMQLYAQAGFTARADYQLMSYTL